MERGYVYEGWRRETGQTLKLALPLIGATLAHIAITTTDVIMMGWLGPAPLASGALANHLMLPIFLLGLGILSAAAPMMAQAIGARRDEEVRPAFQHSFWIGLGLFGFFAIVLWHGGTLLLWLGQEPERAALSQTYLRSVLWSLLPALWLVALRNFLAAHSRPRTILVVTTLGVGFNALGNYALMFGNFGFPALGLVGAGITTVFVNTMMFASILGFILTDRGFARYQLLSGWLQCRLSLFAEIFRIGFPIGLSILAETTLFAGAAMLMGLIGTTELAAHAISLQMISVAFMVPLGLSQAATVRVGYAAGAGSCLGVSRAGWTAIGLGAAFSILPVSCFALLPETLADIFLDLREPGALEVMATVVLLLKIGAVFQVFDGTMIIAAGALRGLKDTRIPMWISVFSYWAVGFASSVALAFWFDLGALGVWSGMALGVFIAAVLLTWRFHRIEGRFGPTPQEALSNP